MSQWTHVNASIRFDGIKGLTKELTEADLGKMCKWEDKDSSHWNSSKLPCGSEGSIEYKIVKTGSEHSVASMVVVFTGDLRDYDDTQEIIDYFSSIVEGRMVRSGIIEVSVEYGTLVILQYDSNEEKFIIVYSSSNKE